MKNLTLNQIFANKIKKKPNDNNRNESVEI